MQMNTSEAMNNARKKGYVMIQRPMRTERQRIHSVVRPVVVLVVLGILILSGCAAGGTPQPAENEPDATTSEPAETTPASSPTSDTASNDAQPSPISAPATPSIDSGPHDTRSADVITGTANVESISINILESMPVQVNVVVQGHLPDGCTQINTIHSRFDAERETFNPTLTTTRPAEAMCTAALVPFEETIALPVEGLEAGPYTVDVNGVTDTFTLAVDNIVQ
jgi:inhibitor of cysteine peptidase